MTRPTTAQLELPMAARPPGPDLVDPLPSRAELEQLRRQIPDTVQFGTSGWEYPGWSGIVWNGNRSADDLARDGILEYAKHPLLTSIYLESGTDAHASERDLRRYVGQLPDALHCILQVHPEVTTPRFTHADEGTWGEGRPGQANPHFLDARFFNNEILQTYRSVFGDRLGPFLFTFPPGLNRAGIAPVSLAERLDRFLMSLPAGTNAAVELREPEYLALNYARVLAAYEVSHVFTTWPGMPSLAAQASAVPTSPELMIQIVDPTGYRQERARVMAPFDSIKQPDQAMREAVVDLMMAQRGVPTYVLVHNEAEGCAPKTIIALARMLARRLAAEP